MRCAFAKARHRIKAGQKKPRRHTHGGCDQAHDRHEPRALPKVPKAPLRVHRKHEALGTQALLRCRQDVGVLAGVCWYVSSHQPLL